MRILARLLRFTAEKLDPNGAPPPEVLSPWDSARFVWVPHVGWRRDPLWVMVRPFRQAHR